MKGTMKQLLVVIAVAFSAQLLAQSAVPRGTILPAELNSSLNSRKSRVGEVITARIMQDVPLASGSTIHAGAKLIGHVMAVKPASAGTNAEISVRFETLVTGGRSIPVVTDLRAMATMMDISEAQVPDQGPDRGTSEYNWVTEQIGGEFRGDGVIAHGDNVVGYAAPNGVLVRVSSEPGTRCRGEEDGDRLQATWVFSSNACGLYGFPEITLAHAGRTNPVGEFTLVANRGNVSVKGGSGMLLRVE
jgi:hypothetical protein